MTSAGGRPWAGASAALCMALTAQTEGQWVPAEAPNRLRCPPSTPSPSSDSRPIPQVCCSRPCGCCHKQSRAMSPGCERLEGVRARPHPHHSFTLLFVCSMEFIQHLLPGGCWEVGGEPDRCQICSQKLPDSGRGAALAKDRPHGGRGRGGRERGTGRPRLGAGTWQEALGGGKGWEA